VAPNGKPQTGFSQTITCDGIVVMGWAPAANLYIKLAPKCTDDHLQQFIPENLPTGVLPADE